MGTLFLGRAVPDPADDPRVALLFPGSASGWVQALPSYGVLQALWARRRTAAASVDLAPRTWRRRRHGRRRVRARLVGARPEGGARMNLRATLAILRKDLALGPRSPIVAWAVVMPVVMTLLRAGRVRLAVRRRPRVGVVDRGRLRAGARCWRCRSSTRAGGDRATLERLVRAHDLDAGLVLARLRRGAARGRAPDAAALRLRREPRLGPRDRVGDDARPGQGGRGPDRAGDGEVVTAGDAPETSLVQRMVPLLVLLALLVAGVFVTSFSLVEERERARSTPSSSRRPPRRRARREGHARPGLAVAMAW
jgi:hypothetical protein